MYTCLLSYMLNLSLINKCWLEVVCWANVIFLCYFCLQESPSRERSLWSKVLLITFIWTSVFICIIRKKDNIGKLFKWNIYLTLALIFCFHVSADKISFSLNLIKLLKGSFWYLKYILLNLIFIHVHFIMIQCLFYTCGFKSNLHYYS